MSRHRSLGRLGQDDDYGDDDDYYDDETPPKNSYMKRGNNAQSPLDPQEEERYLNEGLDYIYEHTGDDFTEDQIVDALQRCEYYPDEAIDLLYNERDAKKKQQQQQPKTKKKPPPKKNPNKAPAPIKANTNAPTQKDEDDIPEGTLLASFGRGRATPLNQPNRPLLSSGRGVDTGLALGRGRGLDMGRGDTTPILNIGRGGGVMPLGRGRGIPIIQQPQEEEDEEEIDEEEEEEQVEESDEEELTSNSNSIEEEDGIQPSVFAQALIYPLFPSNIGQFSDRFFKKQIRSELTNSAKVEEQFKFDEPSPDDIVISKGKATIGKQAENEPFKPIVKQQSKQKPRKEEDDEEPKTPTTPKTPLTKPKQAPPPDHDTLQRINVVIIGHVDAGKSTLMGHVLYQSGGVDDKIIHKYKKESQQIGKSSFHYAWVMDQNAEERQRGITMDVGVKHFDTEHKHVTILDAPGHRDFIPKMITGAVQADLAILVIGSTNGEFEAGFKEGGQTREHLILVRSLGVSKVLVAVNKMDSVEWSQERFEQIKTELTQFLKQIGLTDAQFVPVSGLAGDNLYTKSNKAAWYDGPTLLTMIDEFQVPRDEQDQHKPVRMSISDVYKAMQSGMTVSGKVESGALVVGQQVVLMPVKAVCNVKSISRDGGNMIQAAYNGDNIEVGLTSSSFELETTLSAGQILCDIDKPIPMTNRFLGRVIIFDLEIPITKGSQVQLHLQHVDVAATVTKLVSQLNRQLEVIKKKPRVLTKNTFAIVELTVTDYPVCIELYNEFKSFGRFMVRMGNKTIAAGIVTELKKAKKSKKKKVVERLHPPVQM